MGSHRISAVGNCVWVRIPLESPRVVTAGYENDNDGETPTRITESLTQLAYYYCETADITRPFPSLANVSDPDPHFTWNTALAAPWAALGLRDWAAVLLQGAVWSWNSYCSDGSRLDMMVLVRKTSDFPGMRFQARGLSPDGTGVGNDAEQELIFSRADFPRRISFASLLLRRGTVPLRWSTTVSLAVKVTMQLEADPTRGAEHYFTSYLDRYGRVPIRCVSLLRSESEIAENGTVNEGGLNDVYGSLVADMTKLLGLPITLDKIDWHAARSTHRGKNPLSGPADILWAITDKYLDEGGLTTGFFLLPSAEGGDNVPRNLLLTPIGACEHPQGTLLRMWPETGDPITLRLVMNSRQSSVLRVNCADSLDRTNHVVFLYFLRALLIITARLGAGMRQEIAQDPTNIAQYLRAVPDMEATRAMLDDTLQSQLAGACIFIGNEMSELYTGTGAQLTQELQPFLCDNKQTILLQSNGPSDSVQLGQSMPDIVIGAVRRYNSHNIDKEKHQQYNDFVRGGPIPVRTATDGSQLVFRCLSRPESGAMVISAPPYRGLEAGEQVDISLPPGLLTQLLLGPGIAPFSTAARETQTVVLALSSLGRPTHIALSLPKQCAGHPTALWVQVFGAVSPTPEELESDSTAVWMPISARIALPILQSRVVLALEAKELLSLCSTNRALDTAPEAPRAPDFGCSPVMSPTFIGSYRPEADVMKPASPGVPLQDAISPTPSLFRLIRVVLGSSPGCETLVLPTIELFGEVPSGPFPAPQLRIPEAVTETEEDAETTSAPARMMRQLVQQHAQALGSLPTPKHSAARAAMQRALDALGQNVCCDTVHVPTSGSFEGCVSTMTPVTPLPPLRRCLDLPGFASSPLLTPGVIAPSQIAQQRRRSSLVVLPAPALADSPMPQLSISESGPTDSYSSDLESTPPPQKHDLSSAGASFTQLLLQHLGLASSDICGSNLDPITEHLPFDALLELEVTRAEAGIKSQQRDALVRSLLGTAASEFSLLKRTPLEIIREVFAPRDPTAPALRPAQAPECTLCRCGNVATLVCPACTQAFCSVCYSQGSPVSLSWLTHCPVCACSFCTKQAHDVTALAQRLQPGLFSSYENPTRVMATAADVTAAVAGSLLSPAVLDPQEAAVRAAVLGTVPADLQRGSPFPSVLLPVAVFSAVPMPRDLLPWYAPIGVDDIEASLLLTVPVSRVSGLSFTVPEDGAPFAIEVGVFNLGEFSPQRHVELALNGELLGDGYILRLKLRSTNRIHRLSLLDLSIRVHNEAIPLPALPAPVLAPRQRPAYLPLTIEQTRLYTYPSRVTIDCMLSAVTDIHGVMLSTGARHVLAVRVLFLDPTSVPNAAIIPSADQEYTPEPFVGSCVVTGDGVIHHGQRISIRHDAQRISSFSSSAMSAGEIMHHRMLAQLSLVVPVSPAPNAGEFFTYYLVDARQYVAVRTNIVSLDFILDGDIDQFELPIKFF